MKKLIAISVVFALVVGAAFAQSAISGSISVRAKLLSDTIDNNDDTYAKTSGEIETAYVQFSGQNSEGTFGGLIRMRANENGGNVHRAFTWWRPIPQLEIFFGKDDDGKFAPYNAWSHFQGQEGYAHDHNWRDWRRAMAFTNFDTFGFAFTLKPIEGLEINLVYPTGIIGDADSKQLSHSDRELRSVFGGGLQLTASYAIPDIGKVSFGLKGPSFADQNSAPGNEETDIFDKDYESNFGIIGLTFQLTAVPGLEFLVGGSTILPGKDEDAPVYLALVANYAVSSEFGVKTRWRLSLNGSDGYSQYAYVEDRTTIAFDIQPYYNLGIFTAYLNIGFITTTVGEADPVSQLIINPYIRKGLGAGSIRLGLLYKDPNLDNDDDATIAIPVIFGFNF